ncbi:hypothetical protein AVEN_225981-1 [Araneus ventricosus]|uniref:Mos1 transposase HTH domain-containing protein n=1 Tax=Araneus ventricosus TaxID=182803 RepID=A0A4Y2VUH1_ARAVE|nr:hypothetical protein AVEN_225981-1 [Araneus ventricosus]
MLKKWSRLEVRALILFLWTKNVSTSEIHSQIVEVYGEEAISRQHVAKFCRSFQSDREDVENRNKEASAVQAHIWLPVTISFWGNLRKTYLEQGSLQTVRKCENSC